MELNVGERVVLLSVLPMEGNLTTIRIIHELRQALSFTEEEHKALGFKTEGDQLSWEADRQAVIQIGPQAHVLISQELEKLSDAGALKEDHLSLWDKFVDGERKLEVVG